jgi:hypothetical protein
LPVPDCCKKIFGLVAETAVTFEARDAVDVLAEAELHTASTVAKLTTARTEERILGDRRRPFILRWWWDTKREIFITAAFLAWIYRRKHRRHIDAP